MSCVTRRRFVRPPCEDPRDSARLSTRGTSWTSCPRSHVRLPTIIASSTTGRRLWESKHRSHVTLCETARAKVERLLFFVFFVLFFFASSSSSSSVLSSLSPPSFSSAFRHSWCAPTLAYVDRDFLSPLLARDICLKHPGSPQGVWR